MVMMTVMTTTMMMIKKTTVMMMVVTNPHLFLHAQHQNKPLSAQKSGFPRRGGGERSSSLTTFSSTRSMISITVQCSSTIVPVPVFQHQVHAQYHCTSTIVSVPVFQYQVHNDQFAPVPGPCAAITLTILMMTIGKTLLWSA